MTVEPTLARALDASLRVSRHSSPMKPFVRFAPATQYLFGDDRHRTRSFFWDFDDMLQRALLDVVRESSTPDTLAAACTERWALNLTRLEASSRRELQEFDATGRQPRQGGMARTEYIVERLRPNARFLYAGCGAGKECLEFAGRGLDVVGIDTVPGLIDVANEWARRLALPFKALCLDAMALDPSLGPFDGLLVEFYGNQPSWDRALILQERLSSVMSKNGRGFVVASRRKYASYWFLMGTTYSALMTNRLSVQARFDYRFSQPDRSEEQLRYGLYTRTHTRESLAVELSHRFDVIESTYERDPRYVICVVGRRRARPAQEQCGSSGFAARKTPGLRSGTSTEQVLDKVEAICDMLEKHEKRVQEFYDEPGNAEGESLVKGVAVDYPQFIGLLEEVSSVLPISEVPELPE